MGNKAVDTLLIDFAALLNKLKFSDFTTYRLSGSEFALLVPNVDENTVISHITQLQSDIEHLTDNYQLDDLIHIGIVHYQRTSSYNKLYPAMIEAYEQAKNIGHNAYFIKDDFESSMSDIAWKELISSTIENNTPEITFTAEAYNYDSEPAQKVMDEAFTVVKDSEGNEISIGTFFSMAQEFNLVESLDKCIVNKVIHLMESTAKTTPVTINLSMASVKSHGFNSWLATRIANASINPELLVFSLTAYSAKKDINSFAGFCTFMDKIGAKTLLKRYSSDIVDVELLKDLHINYLRLSRELTSNIAANTDKSKFLELIHDVGALLEIKVLAEGVKDDNDFALVKDAKLFGISR
jgi:EAL domain-containing protein (putative c-di-GMP-specific phosphodiesterase class I)